MVHRIGVLFEALQNARIVANFNHARQIQGHHAVRKHSVQGGVPGGTEEADAGGEHRHFSGAVRAFGR